MPIFPRIPSHRRRFCYALALAASLSTLPGAGGALAQATPLNDHALVVIRFNEPRIYYDQQLYSAISQAVSVKPSVTFAVISYAPETGNAPIDAQWQRTASAHTQAVVASMQNIGVPLSRMQVSGQRATGITFDEVHIIAH